jgi:hypothetical protein
MFIKLSSVYLLLNLFGAYVAYEFGLERPMINLDYLLAGLVFIWLSRSAAALLLIGLFIMEFIRWWIPTYFFSAEAFSVFFWLRTISQWPASILLLTVVVLGMVVLALVMFFRRYRLSWPQKLMATGVIFLLGIGVIFADFVNGSSATFRRETVLYDVNLAGSPLFLVAKKSLEALKGNPASITPIKLGSSATGRYFSEFALSPDPGGRVDPELVQAPSAIQPGQLPDKIVLVVFESLSVMTDHTNLDNWLPPFAQLTGRYTIETGSFDWVGATLRGEIREFCWQSLDGMKIRSVPSSVPLALKQFGYETTAFHGFYKSMYARDELYPLVGFDHAVFLNEMRKEDPGLLLTGTVFRGAADAYVAELVHKEIVRPGKRLVYWMTLSSHLPVNTPLAQKIATPDELRHAGEMPPAVWAYNVICNHTLESIAAIATDESLTNCDFVIVGDHSAFVPNKNLKSAYVPYRVPYLILRHRPPGTLATH